MALFSCGIEVVDFLEILTSVHQLHDVTSQKNVMLVFETVHAKKFILINLI
jgi:hypothetical protein